jgi:SH3 domain-containing YSC84-like protein 1
MKDRSPTLFHFSSKPGLQPCAGARRILFIWSLVTLVGIGPALGAPMQTTVRDCAEIVRDFTRIPEHAIPPSVLRDAKGVAILRVLKGGFIVSGRAGEGVVVARLPGGGWSGPSAIATGGAGFGFQVGGTVTEFVIILNTQAAVDAFAHGGNVEFAGALSVAAGPVGRTAEAGVLPVATVYTYSRSQGLFAGASLEGTALVEQAEQKRCVLSPPGGSRADLTGSRSAATKCGAFDRCASKVLAQNPILPAFRRNRLPQPMPNA